MSMQKTTSPSKSMLSRGIFSNYVGTFGAIAIAFVLSPYLVHTLGDTRYGVWSILSALTGYMLVLDLGVSSALVKYVSHFKAQDDTKAVNEFISSAFAVYILISLCILFLSPLIAFVLTKYIEFDSELGDTIPLLVIITTFNVAFTMFRALFKATLLANQRDDIVQALALSQALFSAIFLFLVLHMGYGLVAMSLVSVIIQIILLAIYSYVTFKFFPNIKVKLSLAKMATAKSAVNFGKFSFLSMLANQLVYFSDAFIIGFFVSAAAVTYYTIASTLAEYTQRMIMSICTSFLPYFSGVEACKNNEALVRSYLTGTKLVIAVTNLFCVGIFLVGSFFIEIWMGEKYAALSTPILLILISIQLVRGPQTLSYALLQGVGKHEVFAYWQTFFAACNLILSIVLVRDYGVLGVAVATAITQITFYGIVTPILSFRYLKIDAVEFIGKTYGASLFPSSLLALALYILVSWHEPGGYFILLAQAGIAAIVYAISYFYCVLDSEERKFVTDKFPRSRAYLKRDDSPS